MVTTHSGIRMYPQYVASGSDHVFTAPSEARVEMVIRILLDRTRTIALTVGLGVTRIIPMTRRRQLVMRCSTRPTTPAIQLRIGAIPSTASRYIPPVADTVSRQYTTITVITSPQLLLLRCTSTPSSRFSRYPMSPGPGLMPITFVLLTAAAHPNSVPDPRVYCKPQNGPS